MTAALCIAMGTPPDDPRIVAAVEAASSWVALRVDGPAEGLVVVIEPRPDGLYNISTGRPTRAELAAAGLRSVAGGVLLVVDLGEDGFYSVPLRWRPIVAGGAA